MVKVLTLMLFSSAYCSQDADHMCRIASKAVSKGYKVNIFLYGDGVHAQMADQAPRAFFNVGAALDELTSRGVVIKSCQRCSKARGYVDGEYSEEGGTYKSSKSLESVKIFALHGLAEMLDEADKVMTFGSAW